MQLVSRLAPTALHRSRSNTPWDTLPFFLAEHCLDFVLYWVPAVAAAADLDDDSERSKRPSTPKPTNWQEAISAMMIAPASHFCHGSRATLSGCFGSANGVQTFAKSSVSGGFRSFSGLKDIRIEKCVPSLSGDP